MLFITPLFIKPDNTLPLLPMYQAQVRPAELYYEVHPGDTLQKVADLYSVDISRVWAANPQLTSPDDLSQANRLKIPQASEILPARPWPAKPEPIPAEIPRSTPAPVVTGGCTNYHSGDYYLDKIIDFESGGNTCARNPGGCFGLLQACPGEPLRLACGGDPGCQIAWFQANKTGGRSWAQVWQHEQQYGWW